MSLKKRPKKTKKMDKLKVGESVWVMANNKAIEVTIKEIVKTDEFIPAINETPSSTKTVYEIWASKDMTNFNKDIEIFDGRYFSSKELLIKSL